MNYLLYRNKCQSVHELNLFLTCALLCISPFRGPNILKFHYLLGPYSVIISFSSSLSNYYDAGGRVLGPYLVIISFSSTARILLKLPHGKPLFTLRMLRRTRDTKPLFFVDERYCDNSLYIYHQENCCFP